MNCSACVIAFIASDSCGSGRNPCSRSSSSAALMIFANWSFSPSSTSIIGVIVCSKSRSNALPSGAPPLRGGASIGWLTPRSACASASGSRWPAVVSRLIRLNRCFNVSVPTMPVSTKVRTPVSRLTMTLPGCGSAWKNPSISSILMDARTAASAIATGSRPAATIDSRSVAGTPSMNSIVITRSADRWRWISGMWTPSISARFCARRRALYASIV